MMTSQLMLLLLLNLACAFGLTLILYRNLLKDKTQRVLALLRFLSFFLLGVLLINPEIDATSYSLEKSKLIFAFDNSESIKKLSKPDQINQFFNEIRNDQELNDSYTIDFISFGSNLISLEDSLTFSEPNTDISKLMEYVNSIEEDNTRLIISTDGNQTVGEDYSLKSFNSDISASALVLGDTISEVDSKIDLVNINNYTYLKNKFPVEVFVSHNNQESTTQKLEVIENENILASRSLEIPAGSSVKTEFLLSAESVGTKVLKVRLQPIPKEKNINNNEKINSIDVIDSRSKILLISDLLHPDIGFFNRILESSKELEFDYKTTEDPINATEYDLVILYQPQPSFQNVLNSVINNNVNYFIIGGSHTNYSYLNSLDLGFQKQLIESTEEYSSVLNSEFTLFLVNELNFNMYPPLKDKFGDLKLNRNYSILLEKELNGIDVESPLWIFGSEKDVKQSVLFGENLWKWRARHYVENSSFTEFDKSFQKIIQFLSQSKFQNEVIVEVEPLINSGDNQLLKVFYYNSNFEIDTRLDFNIKLENLISGDVINSRLLKNSEAYTFNLSELKPGNYSYSIESPDNDIKRNGKFEILDFSAEMQFENANIENLQKIIEKENIYLFSEKSELITRLKNDKPKPIQKSIKKSESLINFEWLILLLALTLSLEWFFRKYKGLI
jgi:hypothetical protein